VASKVIAYLKTTNSSVVFYSHACRLETWFLTLGRQLSNLMPTPKKEAPPLELIFSWVDGIAEGARLVLGGRSLTGGQAFQVQAAIVAKLVSGREMPPCRLSIIKTIMHPSLVEDLGCQDPDCNTRGCRGNRAELVGGGGGGGASSSSNSNSNLGVRIIAPHHKTEDKGRQQGPLDVILPPGQLTEFAVYWIQKGWKVATDTTGSSTSTLFMSSRGFAFNDSTFTHYWKQLMKSAPATLPYFPPNLARTSFVESFTQGQFLPGV